MSRTTSIHEEVEGLKNTLDCIFYDTESSYIEGLITQAREKIETIDKLLATVETNMDDMRKKIDLNYTILKR